MSKNPVRFETNKHLGTTNLNLTDRKTGVDADIDISAGDHVQLLHTLAGGLLNLDLGYRHRQVHKILGDESTSDHWRLHVTTELDEVEIAIWETGKGATKLASNTASLEKVQKRAEKALQALTKLEND